MIKVAIFASGSGSNAEAIVNHFKGNPLLKVAVIYCNNPGAGVLERAERLGIPVNLFDKNDLYNNHRVETQLKEDGISWIVLAGFLWLMPGEIIENYKERIINIHPALLPKYGGKGMYGMRVHEEVVRAAEKESGITIHLVNEEYDSGAVLLQKRVFIRPGTSAPILAGNIHRLEHEYFPPFLEKYILSKSQIGKS